MTALNRLQAQKTALLHQGKQIGKAERKARTRTLIQVVALVKMIGLFETFGIVEGMDLQMDTEHQDKATALLGILVKACDSLSSNPSSQQLEGWKDVGVQAHEKTADEKALSKLSGQNMTNIKNT